MKTIKAVPITQEAFAAFGQFYRLDAPEGVALCGELHQFFPDRLTAQSNHVIGYSPLLVNKPEKMVITQQEYHAATWEMILPLNDDIVLHVSPVSEGTPDTAFSQAFVVPKNTLVKLNEGVWHLAPLPVSEEQLAALIILPERTYANDCTVVDLAPEQQFEVVL